MTEPVFHNLMMASDGPMYVVTASANGERSGCLVGFSTQASIRPARFLTLLSKENHTYGVASAAEVLAVHPLRRSDHAVAAHFGELTSDRVDKFEGIETVEGPGQVPIIVGLDWFAGRILRQFDLGDHVAFLLAPHDGSAARRGEGQLGFQSVRDLEAGHEP